MLLCRSVLVLLRTNTSASSKDAESDTATVSARAAVLGTQHTAQVSLLLSRGKGLVHITTATAIVGRDLDVFHYPLGDLHVCVGQGTLIYQQQGSGSYIATCVMSRLETRTKE